MNTGSKIVREIYDRFLEGDTVRTIADNLTSRGIPTPAGKEKWSVSTILEEFDLDLWNATVESATITADRAFIVKPVEKK